MVFPNGSNSAYDQMVQVEPGIWAIPGVAYHYLKAKQKYNRIKGGSAFFRSTEGFRPLGEPGDWPDIPNTQWFYWERKINQPWQPAGARPGGSIHGWGRAFDIDLSQSGLDYWLMRQCLEEEGFVFDIEGEPWHCNYYAADMWTVYDLPDLEEKPLPKPNNEMETIVSLPILIADKERVGILALLEDGKWLDIPISGDGQNMVAAAVVANRTYFPDRDVTVYLTGAQFIAFRALHTDGKPETVRIEGLSPEAVRDFKNGIQALGVTTTLDLG